MEMIQTRQTAGPTARDLMSEAETIRGSDSVVSAAERLVEVGLPAMPVVDDDGGVLGFMTNRDIVEAVAQRDLGSVAAQDVVRPVARISVETPLDRIRELLREELRLPVVEETRLVGVITRAEVDAYLALADELGPNIDYLNLALSPNDFRGHRFFHGAHLRAGLSALQCVRRAIAEPQRILDFPCGQGRILRVLAAAFPAAEIVACDIERGGVDFCASTFGAKPVYSEEDPRALDLGTFDLIWCGSLFTHLPAERWSWFLELFHRSLGPDGVLVLTTLSPKGHTTLRRSGLTEEQQDRLASGGQFSYVDYEGQRGYGLALATTEWVQALLDDHGFNVLRVDPDGWFAPHPNQDVFTTARS